MAYTKPPANNMPFRFTSSGYTGPSGGNISYNFGAAGTANLQAAINVLSEDYLKECPTYTIAYGGKIQVIQLPCIYGGYRSLGAYIYGNPEYADLGAFIRAVVGQGNLGAFIRPTIQQFNNLGAYVYSIPPADLTGLIHGWDTRDLSAILHGWQAVDLSAEIGAHPPADIQAILNIIEIRDLPASITGEWWHGQANLGAEVYKIYQRGYKDLSATLQGWADVDLPGYINIVYKADLQALIIATTETNLGASVYGIPPADIIGLIHGWATKDLPAVLTGVYGPYDIQAYLNPIPSQDLPAYIRGWKGYQVPIDLPAILSGWQAADLGAYIGAIVSANLAARITADGQAVDLGATIIPKTIHMKRALMVSLLEHIDLGATINFQCFASRYVDLSARIKAIYKADLRASIWGYRDADNEYNLGAYINTTGYYVQDTYTTKFIPEIRKYTQLKLSFSTATIYRVFDTLPIFYGNFYGLDLPATITGILTSANLGALINPIIQANYTELPDGVWPKTHEIVIDFDDNWKENWRRTVELLFRRDGDDPYHYFYVSGSQQVYRLDRSKHWTIWAKSYVETEDMIERRNIRRKYIFKMSDYNTIDEAIRDIIDRVSTYRQTDLRASITSIMPNYKDLNASINIITGKKTWVKNLKATITAV